jgi:hypothetical protein
MDPCRPKKQRPRGTRTFQWPMANLSFHAVADLDRVRAATVNLCLRNGPMLVPKVQSDVRLATVSSLQAARMMRNAALRVVVLHVAPSPG